MASFVMSASAVKAPAVKVSGLGFRKAVSAVAMPKAAAKPVQAHAAFSVVCGKPGAKGFKITASGKVRMRNHLTPATARTRAHPGRDKA